MATVVVVCVAVCTVVTVVVPFVVVTVVVANGLVAYVAIAGVVTFCIRYDTSVVFIQLLLLTYIGVVLSDCTTT